MQNKQRYETEYFNSGDEFCRWMAQHVGEVYLKEVVGRTEFGVKGIFQTIEWFVSDMRVKYYPGVKGYSVAIGSAVGGLSSAYSKATSYPHMNAKNAKTVGCLQREAYYQGGGGDTTSYACVVRQYPSGSSYDKLYVKGNEVAKRKTTVVMDDDVDCWFSINGKDLLRYEADDFFFGDGELSKDLWDALRLREYNITYLTHGMRPENVRELRYQIWKDYQVTEHYGDNVNLFDLIGEGFYQKTLLDAEPLENISIRINHYLMHGELYGRVGVNKLGTFRDEGKKVTLYDVRSNDFASNALRVKKGLFGNIERDDALDYISGIIRKENETRRSFIEFLTTAETDVLLNFLTVLAPGKGFFEPEDSEENSESANETEKSEGDEYYVVSPYEGDDDTRLAVVCKLFERGETVFEWNHIAVYFAYEKDGKIQEESFFPFGLTDHDAEFLRQYLTIAPKAMNHFLRNPSRENDFSYLVLKSSGEILKKMYLQKTETAND